MASEVVSMFSYYEWCCRQHWHAGVSLVCWLHYRIDTQKRVSWIKWSPVFGHLKDGYGWQNGCVKMFFSFTSPHQCFFFFCFVLLLATLNGALISHYSLICLCRWLILLSVFMYLLALRISSKKCLKSSYSVCCSASSFYILDANPLSDEQLVNALSHSVGCLFTLV